MPRTIIFSWIDWVTLAIVLVSFLRGLRYGVWAGAGDLAALVAAFLAASALYAEGAARVLRYFPVPARPWADLLSLVVIWIVLYVPTSWMLRLALGGVPFPASRALGALLGGFRGLVLVTILLIIALAAPFRSVVSTDAAHSQVAPYLLRANARVSAVLFPALPARVPRLGPDGAVF